MGSQRLRHDWVTDLTDWSWSACTLLCSNLCDSINCSPPGCSVHSISQARILEWVAISFISECFQPRINLHLLLEENNPYCTVTLRRGKPPCSYQVNKSVKTKQNKTKRSVFICIIKKKSHFCGTFKGIEKMETNKKEQQKKRLKEWGRRGSFEIKLQLKFLMRQINEEFGIFIFLFQVDFFLHES